MKKQQKSPKKPSNTKLKLAGGIVAGLVILAALLFVV